MLDNAFYIMCIMLGLSLGYYYSTIWAYIGYIDDAMIVYRMILRC